MKEYFSHDYNASNDPKIMALIYDHGAVGYGIYWVLIEMLHIEKAHSLYITGIFIIKLQYNMQKPET